MPVKLITPSNGSVTLSTPDTASNVTVTIPATTDTLVNLSSSQTLNNKTLSNPAFTGSPSGGTFTSTTITAANGNTVEATSGPTSTQLAGQRNKIINGAMMIDQRNAGAAVTPTGGQYLVDRWQYQANQTSKFTAQQNAGSVTPPAGLPNYLGLTSSSAYSVGTNDYFAVTQPIEGFNFCDLAFGTSNAKSVTLSFWVYSSLTGTFGGSLQNYAETRLYAFSYTVNSANTWTYITVTIPGDTAGTWVGASSAGAAYVWFGLGAGSGREGAAGAWGSSLYLQPTGSVNVVSTSGATFYITGVQLEKGATATPFENRLYGTELALCQRYYEKISNSIYVTGYANGTTELRMPIPFMVPKRASPTISTATAGNFWVQSGATNYAVSAIAVYAASSGSAWIGVTTSGLTAGGAGALIDQTSGSYVAASAEL